MEKIAGILSMQRVLNYGSFLQAYALKQLLLQNGADEVYFIDIEKGRSLPGYEPNAFGWKKVERVLSLVLKGYLWVRLRDRKFMKQLTASIRAQFPVLGLDDSRPSHFDIAFIGSDEVFNCCQKSTWGYTLQLYGLIPQADRVVSYAGSFGHTTYEQLLKLGVVGEIGNTMKKLSAISVRDQNSYEIVKKVSGIEPEIHLDPVLIYGYKKEIADSNIGDQSSPYMVVYSYQGRISDKKEINEIVTYAKDRNLKLVSIYCRYDWCDEAVITDTPFDVLSWFKGAECIVTDTFHGSIFSIITHRRFCTLMRDNNKQKLGSLLKQLSLDDRMVRIGDHKSISSILNIPIDYDLIEDILLNEREKAQMYIRKQLELLASNSDVLPGSC